jgi:hypothetical protein
MKNIFLILALIALIVGCQPTNKNKTHLEKGEKQSGESSNPVTIENVTEKGSTNDLSPITLSWSDSLLKMYMAFADNELIKQARKGNYYEEWIYDNTLKTDSAIYDVYRIGHDVPKADYSDTLFVVDQWVYVNTMTKQLFEYNIHDKKLTRWWTSEDEKNFFYPVYELSPKTTAFVIPFREPEELSFLDTLFNKFYPADSLYGIYNNTFYNASSVAKKWKVYDTTGYYRLMKSDKFEKAARKYFDREFYVYGIKGVVKTKVKNIAFGLSECITNIFAFCFDNSSIKNIGHPVFCSSKQIDIAYGTDYSKIEAGIERYLSTLPADYSDSIKEKVLGHVGNFYFVYHDDFLWGRNPRGPRCKFPARSVWLIEKGAIADALRMNELDLFGIECD